jgi:tol-pal system protein YbgF
MLHIAFPSKLTIALAAAAMLCAAPAFAETRADLADRIGMLEKNAAQARTELQVAQAYNRPPADVPGGGGYGGGQDAAGLDVRVDRLENQMRTLNGQIEQMQFDIKRLDDELRKFQQDVDFRFQDNGHGAPPVAPPPRAGQRHSEITDPSVPAAANSVDSASAQYGAPGRGRRTSDAFDPSADPNAPGAPRPMGTLPGQDIAQSDAGAPAIIAAPVGAGPSPALPQGPLVADRDPNAPLELASAPHAPPPAPTYATPTYATPSSPAVLPAASGQGPVAASSAGRNIAAGAQVAALTPSNSRDDFDAAAAALKTQQFEVAEADFKTFLDKYPKDRLVPDAVFDLGESYFARNRYRDAAEQYLKISSDYAKTARAPQSLLRLGQSLGKLGAKEQACAAFAEVGRKYPTATASVRAAADRESKRDQC